MSEVTVRIEDKGFGGIPMLRIGGVDRITPLVLIEVADLCFENYKTCDVSLRVSWYNYSQAAADIVNEDACPEEGVPLLGYFALERLEFPSLGDQVIINKGLGVRSYHPKDGTEVSVSERRQTVTVSNVINGFIDFDRGVRIVNPIVRWAGAGGYWRWVSAEKVEMLEPVA